VGGAGTLTGAGRQNGGENGLMDPDRERDWRIFDAIGNGRNEYPRFGHRDWRPREPNQWQLTVTSLLDRQAAG